MDYKHVLLIGFLILILILSYVYWKVDNDKERSKLSGYISMLAIIGTFVLLLSFIESSSNNQRNNIRGQIADAITNDQKGINEIERIFLEQGPTLRRLYKQLYPNNPNIINLPDSPITNEIIEREQHMLSIMLQNIETVLYPLTSNLSRFNLIQLEPWLLIIRQWFRSPLLLDYWNSHRQFYTTATQKFVTDNIIGQ